MIKPYGYMCKIDFDHYLGCDPRGVLIYPEEDDLREDHDCADTCGIVKVSIILDEVIKETAEDL